MSKFLYAISVILIICWAVGFFAFNAGTFIHLLLALAFIAVFINIAQEQKI